MTTKAVRTRKKAVVSDPTAVNVELNPDEDRGAALARICLMPSVQSAATIIAFQGTADGDMPINAVIDELERQCDASTAGNGARCEQMLVAQAHALDAIFGEFSRRAKRAEYMHQLDPYLRIALRAQNQCRATWESLAAIKNPPVMFAKQANIAHGPQQMNNGVAPPVEASRTENIESTPNKLLGAHDGQRLDTRAPSTASGANQEVETVGAINGAEDRER